jgi:hypothetical protein
MNRQYNAAECGTFVRLAESAFPILSVPDSVKRLNKGELIRMTIESVPTWTLQSHIV